MREVDLREMIGRLAEGDLNLGDRSFIAWGAARGMRHYLRSEDIGPAVGCYDILTKLYKDKSPRIRRLVADAHQEFDQQVGAA